MLASCLQALLKQDYAGRFEIIVVNNGSTDETANIARSMGVIVIEEMKKGYVHALRAGFAAATGEIIACTDADTRVPPSWLSRIHTLLSIPNTAGCSGIFRFYDGPAWLQLIGKVFGRCNYHLAGANMAVWRSAYCASGGFNPHVNMGADVELGQRLKRQGKVIIDQKLRADTSGRRFQCAFFQTLCLYYLNDLWLLLFKRPLFYNFPNIRIPARATKRQVYKPLLARIAMALGLIGCFLWVAENTNNQIFGPVMAHGQQNEPLVALTFDDGPSHYTSQILDTLDKYGVKATFFEIGCNVDRYPAIARRIINEGHVIGNHTFSHPFLAPMEPPAQIKREIDKASESIKNATGCTPVLFRPPHGWRSPWMASELRRDNYTVVTWTVSPDDWQQTISAANVVKRVLSKTHSGSIILLHDGLETKDTFRKDQTIDALPSIIADLKSHGYRFVTVPELMEASQTFVPKNISLRP
jgi:peptidoglycan/xylan/chitin deacetylase (PgdA/CDA1 family)